MYYNFRIGIVSKWKRFLFLALCTAALCCYYSLLAGGLSLTAADYYAFLMQGEPPASSNPDVPYNIPVISMLLFLLQILCVDNFAADELQTGNETAILLHKSRSGWWRQKSFICLCSTLLYFAVLWSSIALTAGVKGALSLGMNLEYHADLFMSGIPSAANQVIAMIVVPLLCSAALMQLKMTLSICIGSFQSILALIVVFVCSAYIRTPLLPGNGLMLIRSRCFSPDGIPAWQMMLSAGIWWGVSYIAGRRFFMRHPIMKKGQEE